MQTPIADFVKEYTNKKSSRFHMPGHKGQAFLGCEAFDITEIAGADALYEAQGIIAESEYNATELFGTAKTVYSTEGSSQCIRAMMHMAVGYWKERRVQTKGNGEHNDADRNLKGYRPYVIASRNVHKSFLYAAALVDFDVVWLYPKEMHSLCSCIISTEQLIEEIEKQIKKHQGIPPAAVYVTSPDYLGGQSAISAFAKICNDFDTILTVDNAHGAYLHFLEKPQHPMDLGADMCCDSAHKTLPVLTGGAYLQIHKNAPEFFKEHAKGAMALFGSTSPSYLIMASLDLCNAYLKNGYVEKLTATIEKLNQLKDRLKGHNWKIEDSDSLKVTIDVTGYSTGYELEVYLRNNGIECEYADEKYVVLMVTPENTKEDFDVLCHVLDGYNHSLKRTERKLQLQPVSCEQILTIREAIFAGQEMVKVEDAVGRICGSPTVGCPPAIPVVVAGEIINERAVEVFDYYGIKQVSVVR